MPTPGSPGSPGYAWRHVIITTHNSWLPGDPRGWRSRSHKRHSSGDYQTPPPTSEHAGLRKYAQQVSGKPTVITPDCLPTVGQAIMAELEMDSYRLLALSVAATHAHFLVELPDNIPWIRRIVGRCKLKSSRAIRTSLPGRVWAGGGKFQRIRDQQHQNNTYRYILDHAEQGAWVWSYKQR